MIITYEFATHDDCLLQMLPSDLRQLVNERDQAYRNIDILKSERDALAAQVEALRDAASEAAEALGFLSRHLQGRMGEAALMDMAEKADSLNDALAATPQQHLAEIRAEAGRLGYIEGAMNYDPDDDMDLGADYYANQYADSIRQGEVK